MIANAEVARELGHIKVKDGTIMEVEDLDGLPPESSVVICTGSQGEPFSALALIAAGEHKFVKVETGDTVILSASAIPGNESAVHRVINGLYRAGADVHHPGTTEVHVSGHAAREELAELLRTVRPRMFAPVHGEYRQLALHARLAVANGIEESNVFIVEDGDVLEMRDGRVKRGEPIHAGMVLVDGLGVGDVGPVVLRDRRVLAGDGILICVVTIDSQTGELLAGPDLISRGFVHEDESRDLLEEAADRVEDALLALEDEQATDWGALKKATRRALGEFVWRSTNRRPMILPIIMEV
jgi:ribonuclease J